MDFPNRAIISCTVHAKSSYNIQLLHVASIAINIPVEELFQSAAVRFFYIKQNPYTILFNLT